MERPRSMPRYSASRFAGIADTAPLQDGSGAARAAAVGPLSTTSSAKRTRFVMLPLRRAFSRFRRFSEEEERQGRSRATGAGDAGAAEPMSARCGGLARQRLKSTRVPESAMAVAARARPAWDPPSAEPAAAAEDDDDDAMAQTAGRLLHSLQAAAEQSRDPRTATVEGGSSVAGEV